MKNRENSSDAIHPDGIELVFVPDIYYFPIQVEFELTSIQNNFLGKVLTIVEALNLPEKQEKATKDLIRTVVKEQMIKSRQMLDDRLDGVIKLGIKPIEETEIGVGPFFTRSYKMKTVYDSDDSLIGDGYKKN